MQDPEVFATTVTRKLMTYALGRGLEPYDMPAIRRIVREAGPGGLKLSALVTGIVRSVPFQMRRTAGQSGVPNARSWRVGVEAGVPNARLSCRGR